MGGGCNTGEVVVMGGWGSFINPAAHESRVCSYWQREGAAEPDTTTHPVRAAKQ